MIYYKNVVDVEPLLVFISKPCISFVTNVIISNIAIRHNAFSFKKKGNREGEGESKK